MAICKIAENINNGSFKHISVVLKPLNPDYEDIVITEATREDEFVVVGEFYGVIKE